MYTLAFQRPPTAEERSLALGFVNRTPAAPPEPAPNTVWSYGTGQFDPATSRVEHWRPLPHFTGEQWQWEAKVPSADGKWTLLSREGERWRFSSRIRTSSTTAFCSLLRLKQ